MAIQGPNTYGNYINEAFKDPRYAAAEKAVSDSQAALDALVNQAPTFQTDEQKRIMAADKFLPTFNADRAKQVGDLYARPATARAEYQDIFDPSRRSALVAQAVGNTLGQLSGTNEAIAQRKGTATDLATQAYNQLLARIEGQRSSLDTAKEKRSTLKGLLEDAAKSYYEEQQYEKRRKQALADNAARASSGQGGDETVNTSKYKVKYDYDPKTGKNSGVTFLDGKGRKIPAAQYAIDTGTPIDQLLIGTGDTGDAEVAGLIQRARAAGQTEGEILSDLAESGKYNHLFGIQSTAPSSTNEPAKKTDYNSGIFGGINKLADTLFPWQ